MSGGSTEGADHGLPGRILGKAVGGVVSPIVDNVDVDEILRGVDVDEIVRRIDVDEIVRRVDVDDVVQRIDIDALLARVDLDGLLDQIDMDRLLDRIDMDQLLDRIDIDRLVDRLDVQRVVDRVDVNSVIERTELGAIIARSTTGVFTEILDVARTQIVTVDQFVQGVAGLALRRSPRELPPAPHAAPARTETIAPSGIGRGPAAAESTEAIAPSGIGRGPAAAESTEPGPDEGGNDGADATESVDALSLRAPERAIEVQGRFAGSVSRFLAFLLDQGMIAALFALGTLLTQAAIRVLFADQVSIDDGRTAIAVLYTVWAFTYITASLAATGRTIGKAVLGVMVVRTDGSKLRGRDAAIRTLVFPLNFFTLGVGFLLGLFRRDRRELHDLIAGTAVIYAWDAQTAQLRAAALAEVEIAHSP